MPEKKAAAKKAAKGFAGMTFIDDVGEIIDVIDLGREALVIRVSTWKGKRSLDIRRFYDDDGTWRPGKGTGIPAGDVKYFLATLAKNSTRIQKAIG